MGIRRRGNIWWTDFVVRGQRIQRSTGTSEKAAAQEFHDRLKADIWRQTYLEERPRKTWKEAVTQWCREKAHKASIDRDLEKVEWLDPHFGSLHLDEITRERIEAVAAIKEREAAPATVNRYLAFIRAVLRAAERDWGYIDRAPAVRMRREPKRRVRWLTPDEAHQLLEAMPAWMRQPARFSFATGVRRRNCFDLTWRQVDLGRRIAWVHAEDTKARKTLRVPLNDDAVAVLTEQVGVHDELVFVNAEGGWIKEIRSAQWAQVLKAAKLSNFRWHDIRHTWASWHVMNGTSLQELMELGGWSSYEMVLRYAHLAPDHLQAAANRVHVTKSPTPKLRAVGDENGET